MRTPLPLFPSFLGVLLLCLGACGGPDQATVDAIAVAEQGLAAGVGHVEGFRITEAHTAWTANQPTLTRHGAVVIMGKSAADRLQAVSIRYRTALDQDAEAWIERFEADVERWPQVRELAQAVGAHKISAVIAKREKAKAEQAAKEEAARAAEQLLVDLPRTILIRTRLSSSLPTSLNKLLPDLTAAVVKAIQEKAGDLPVRLHGSDFPQGLEACAACIVDVDVAADYVSYGKPGAMHMSVGAYQSVPQSLSLHVVSHQGSAFDLGLDATISAARDAPEEISPLQVDNVSRTQSEYLNNEVIRAIPGKIPTFDTAALARQIRAADLNLAAIPLVFITCTSRIGEEPRQRGAPIVQHGSSPHTMPQGTSRFREEMVALIAQRMGPVRITTDEKDPAAQRVTVESTLYYSMFGRSDAGLNYNNGSLPYRADVTILVENTGDTRHPWSGRHQYHAATPLPETLDGFGELGAAAQAAAAALAAQVGTQMAGERQYEKSYRPPGAGEVDEYILVLRPKGTFARTSVLESDWFRKLPGAVRTGLANHMAPASVVLPGQETPGRVAGLIVVEVEGRLSSMQDRETRENRVEPTHLDFSIDVATSFAPNPHSWEGGHEIPADCDIMGRMQQTGQRAKTLEQQVITALRK